MTRQRAFNVNEFSEEYGIGRTKAYEELRTRGGCAVERLESARSDCRSRCRGLGSSNCHCLPVAEAYEHESNEKAPALWRRSGLP